MAAVGRHRRGSAFVGEDAISSSPGITEHWPHKNSASASPVDPSGIGDGCRGWLCTPGARWPSFSLAFSPHPSGVREGDPFAHPAGARVIAGPFSRGAEPPLATFVRPSGTRTGRIMTAVGCDARNPRRVSQIALTPTSGDTQLLPLKYFPADASAAGPIGECGAGEIFPTGFGGTSSRCMNYAQALLPVPPQWRHLSEARHS